MKYRFIIYQELSVGLCLAGMLLFFSVSAWAARANGEWHTYLQPDGKELTVSLRGDEWFSYYITPDGITLYEDESGFLVPVNPDSLSVQCSRQMEKARRHLPSKRTNWDPNRIYRQAVILIEFNDFNFSMKNPQVRYDSIFNRSGYNEGKGLGCVADYFRDQSGGRFNLQFDIYGPITVDEKANKGKKNTGASTLMAATQKLIDSLNVDFAPYDWDNDGAVEQVVYVYAGPGGNQITGYLWPNTASFNTVNSGDGKRISNYSASAEKWNETSSKLCGIGTICHEFTHCLGLPDLYPSKDTNNSSFSVVDEWDLMDGGNFTNQGWCPCNYTAHEKMQLGWYQPLELTEATTITGMKPLNEGGDAYIIKKTNDEFYMLENRQWTGWDILLPSHGLLIAHVDYSSSIWSSNSVNNYSNHLRYYYIPADGHNYDDWKAKIGGNNPYVLGHNQHLSGTPYPFEDGDTVYNALTDTSTPPAMTYAQPGKMSKPITNIMEVNGTIAFDFMGGDPLAGIATYIRRPDMEQPLQSIPLDARHRLYFVRDAEGHYHKIIR